MGMSATLWMTGNEKAPYFQLRLQKGVIEFVWGR